jgi:hypothetical protein
LAGSRLFPAEEPDGPNQACQKPSPEYSHVEIVRMQRCSPNHYLAQGITRMSERHGVQDGSHELRHHVNGEEDAGQKHHGKRHHHEHG